MNETATRDKLVFIHRRRYTWTFNDSHITSSNLWKKRK